MGSLHALEERVVNGTEVPTFEDAIEVLKGHQVTCDHSECRARNGGYASAISLLEVLAGQRQEAQGSNDG